MASVLEKDVRLVGDAARGNGDSLMMLGLRAYWDYDMIGGVQTVEEAQLAIDAAAVCGKGEEADTAGDFYRFELQSEKSEGFYAYSALCRLEEALSGDGAAQMNLAEKYAFGRGLAQNDEKTCFWTQAAAASGNDEAVGMMKNFWQMGDVLPVCATMAEKCQQPTRESGAEVKAVRAALIEKEAAETYAEAAYGSRAVTKRFDLVNLSKTPAAAVINPILNFIAKLSGTVLTVYVIAGILIFLVNFFAGYHETGLFHYVNLAHEFLLGIPIKALLVVMTDLGFGEITAATMCEWFCLNGNLIVGAFGLVFSGVAAGLWLGLCGGAHAVLLVILSLAYRQGVKITPKKKAADVQRRAAACSDKAYRTLLYHRPELQKYSTCQLMAICGIADCYGSNITNSAKFFDAVLQANEARSLPIVFRYGQKQYYSTMGLYFVLRRHFGAGFVPGEKHAFDPKGSFMQAYKAYRKGKDFKNAEKMLQGVIDSADASVKEKAWAKYVIYLMCYGEYLYHDKDDQDMKRADEATMERGERLRREAESHCILANCSPEALLSNAWAGDPFALQLLGHFAADPQVSEYLRWCAGNTDGDRHHCGDPCGKKTWSFGILWTDDHKIHEYETNCLEAQLEVLSGELEKIYKKYEKVYAHRSTCEDYRKELRALRKKVQAVFDKGYTLSGVMLRGIDGVIGVLDEVILEQINQSIMEDRMRQEREDAINRKVARFDEAMDDRERALNMLAYGEIETNFDRHLMGKMSDRAFYPSDYDRHLKREQYRRELENSQDAY